MNNSSLSLSLLFISIIVGIAALCIFAFEKKKVSIAFKMYVGTLVWLVLVAYIGMEDFFIDEGETFPPRLAYAMAPAFLLVLIIAYSRYFSELRTAIPLGWFIIFHVIRIPVEYCIFKLYQTGDLPREMTWLGGNFDILSGITAPVVYYLYNKQWVNRTFVFIWNLVCLALLINVMLTAAFSIPSPFQAFNPPNIAVLNFPFVWLPTFIVPIVLLVHLITLRKIFREGFVSTRKKKKSRHKSRHKSQTAAATE